VPLSPLGLLECANIHTGDCVTQTFGFGHTAEVLDEATGTVHTWTIVSPREADAGQGRLSEESPVAKALLGRGSGDSVEVQTPRGPRKYRVERLVS
jgi:transcription elongation factor GreA